MLRAACYALVLAVASSCGDSPSTPDPVVVTPPPVVIVNNSVPVISSITVQGTRQNQPPGFADLGESIAVSAVVTDAETALDLLQYNWTATLGSFTGTGRNVSWVAPASASTPVNVVITLEVVERFGANQENKVSRTANVSLHNSAKEVGDMARQFLLEFSDSNLRDTAVILRNFTDATKTCADGKAAEASDITKNRIDYRIVASTIGADTVTVGFGGRCAYRSKPGDACARVPSSWTSVRLTPGGPTAVGATERVTGIDQVTAIYLRDQQKWGLCESDFDGVLGLRSSFIR